MVPVDSINQPYGMGVCLVSLSRLNSQQDQPYNHLSTRRPVIAGMEIVDKILQEKVLKCLHVIRWWQVGVKKQENLDNHFPITFPSCVERPVGIYDYQWIDLSSLEFIGLIYG